MTARMNIESLEKLPDNLDCRGSLAPTAGALKTAASFCTVPLGSGGVQVECRAGGIDLEIEVDAVGNVTNIFWARRSY
jgi:hypothetical protein